MLHLSMRTLLVEKWKKQCAERSVYLIWQKNIIENRDKSKITKHLIFPISFCQREILFNFYKFDNIVIDF